MDEYNRRPVLKSLLSGKNTSKGSPSFRRLNSSRTPRRGDRSSGFGTNCFRSNRIVLWLLLITLWAYAGFYIQSRWAHGDNKDGIFGGSDESEEKSSVAEEGYRRDLKTSDDVVIDPVVTNVNISDVKKTDMVIGKNGTSVVSRSVVAVKKKSKRSRRSSRSRRGNQKKVLETTSNEVDVQEEELPQTNATYGMLVGPFGSIEDSVLEWNPSKRSGTCDRSSQFARLVWSRKFVLIFHELSMTGAPLSMMELASELLSCGATVSVVALSRKGGLLKELARKRIKVLEDKDKISFKTAMKADLVIAGSAVCASWIEQYIDHSVAGSRKLVWWIMENRREYFDRSKLVLNRVKTLAFLSESQSKQWMAWCEEENIQFKTAPSFVPLSVNDELAFVAGISCSLNTPAFSTEKMMEKRLLLRKSVREEMGIKDTDMLVIALSSINPGKGHFLLLESVNLAIDIKRGGPVDDGVSRKKMLRGSEEKKGKDIKLLIGSVGSKSNKVVYVKSLLSLLSNHSDLPKSVLWTPATTRVASLYSAADVYVINSQGLGETFGRVTIEAMAFGIPVLGTDAGGTKEIVEHNVTGLLHPIGHPGTTVLSKNLQYLLKNPSERQRMGLEGREKVKRMYLKRHMYKMFWQCLHTFIFPSSNRTEHGQNIPPAPPPSSRWSSRDPASSTKKKRMKSNYRFRSWADLPTNILSSIADRLEIIELLSFRGTCKDFRRASCYASARIESCRIPLILAHHPYDIRKCFIYTQQRSNPYIIDLPELKACMFLASYQGWLLVFKPKQRSIFFFAPFSRAKILLPDFPINQIQHHATAFSALPTSAHCIVSIRTPHEVFVISKGQTTWARHEVPNDISCLWPATTTTTMTCAGFDRKTQTFYYLDNWKCVLKFSIKDCKVANHPVNDIVKDIHDALPFRYIKDAFDQVWRQQMRKYDTIDDPFHLNRVNILIFAAVMKDATAIIKVKKRMLLDENPSVDDDATNLTRLFCASVKKAEAIDHRKQNHTGPEIRTGFLKDGQPIQLQEGQEITIATDYTPSKVSGRMLISLGLLLLRKTKMIFCYGVIPNKIDIIAMSFVRKGADVVEVRNLLGKHAKSIILMTKVENQEGVANFDDILAEAHAFMVARGDLGMEISIEKMFLTQKFMIHKCNIHGKPVVTATQMLESMIKCPHPTRAEATDVANAVIDGTDCVQTMARICIEAEDSLDYKRVFKRAMETAPMPAHWRQICAKQVWRNNSKLLAKYRPSMPLLSIVVPKINPADSFDWSCSDESPARHVLVSPGLVAILSKATSSTESCDKAVELVIEEAKDREICKAGDSVVVLHRASGSSLVKILNVK
ncbi:UDP-Glycosyltransferase superfamily protein [Artemisia annua]|uniref:UDP-Glycosyltransferase superfamily protein n=1 Tax=Artemisia annua TaxID=35608 RepID=A0A2U1N689_ARTAN|nr:UDP-Glycosyltransferase superfamily protein [Artemisia annua]